MCRRFIMCCLVDRESVPEITLISFWSSTFVSLICTAYICMCTHFNHAEVTKYFKIIPKSAKVALEFYMSIDLDISLDISGNINVVWMTVNLRKRTVSKHSNMLLSDMISFTLSKTKVLTHKEEILFSFFLSDLMPYNEATVKDNQSSF